MAIENILSEIDAEIARLQRARALLATLGSATTKPSRGAKTVSYTHLTLPTN